MLGCLSVGWAAGCEPKVTVADGGDAGSSAGDDGLGEGSGGASASGGVAGSAPKAGSGGGGSGGTGGIPPIGPGGADTGATGGTAGNENVSGSGGVQVEIRPATAEEDSIPESCEFTFAPPNGGTGGQGSGGAFTGGTGNVAGGGAGGTLPDDGSAGDGSAGDGSAGDGSAESSPFGSSGSAAFANLPQCGCTRRPGTGTSFQCPWGEGLTVSTQIGPDGGSIHLQGTESTVGVPVEIRIPRGALSETVTISITELSVPPPDDLSDWSPLYRFEPSGLTFERPAEVRVPWSGNSGVVASGLSLYVSSEPGGSCDMKPLSDNYVNAGFNQGTLWHLGWAIVGVPKPEGCP
jgi:hypothetical protein